MSFDIVLQAFERGDAHVADATALRRALAPYLIQVLDGWNLRAGSATAEIYGVEKLASGFMATHIDGVELYDVLVTVAQTCDLVILPVGCSVAVVRAEQLDHLPDDLREDVVLVTSGADLRALIERARQP